MLLSPYSLPDHELLQSPENWGFSIFQPDRFYIVLGKSNLASQSVIETEAEALNIKIIQRPSGGEAVLLSPKMMVIAIKMPLQGTKHPSHYFQFANQLIIDCLSQFGVQYLQSKGISDLSIGDKKILGSSIYRSPNFMFYHAVLNLSEDIDWIARLLKHPKKEPDYRQGRTHSSFVSSLLKEGYDITFEDLENCLRKNISATNPLLQ
jgi:lipoate-protein ligase A